MGREFAVEKRLKQNSIGGVIDIPHPLTLKLQTPEQLIQHFRLEWGEDPEGVVLPVTTAGGIMFKVNGLEDFCSPTLDQLEGDGTFRYLVNMFSNLGMDIYLSIDPTLPFIQTDSLSIVDILGDPSAQLCVNNPRSQEIISAILGTGIDIALESTSSQGKKGKLRGCVIDAVDLWPLGGVEDRLELTCFCSACNRFFQSAAPKLLHSFKKSPNPWNLLLRVTPTGIAHIDDIGVETSLEEVIALSQQKGFVEVFRDREETELLEYAKSLTEYIEARHNLTVRALIDIFEQAYYDLSQTERLDRIVLTEGSRYDWTSGIQVERLTPDTGITEVWIEQLSIDPAPVNIPYRSYLWKRTRYYIDAFVSLTEIVQNPFRRQETSLGKLPNSSIYKLLVQRHEQAHAASVGSASTLAALPTPSQTDSQSKRVGFVGVAFSEKLSTYLLDAVAQSLGITTKESQEQ